MPSYGISDTGFNRKRLDVLLSELDASTIAIFGDNFNVSPESPDGQVNGIISESNANLWELAEFVYNAFNPSAASGVSLSNLVQMNGITRLPETNSRVELTLTGTIGTSILAGNFVSANDSGEQFEIESDVIIGSGGVVTVFASAINAGPILGLASTIGTIDTPITGWDTVNNISDAIEGSFEETDVELRSRREGSIASASQSIIDAIFAAVSNVDGVTNVTILENDTYAFDVNRTPPKSFHTIVVGGVDEDIASAISLKKTIGIRPYGTTDVILQDSQGIDHTVSFSRPTEIDIHIEMTLIKGSNYPVDGDDQIKQAIIDYANGNLVVGSEFSLGDDVIYSRLYTPINSIPDHEVDSLFIGITSSPTGEINIPIDVDEISRFTIGNIVIL